MRPAATILALSCALLLAACGGSEAQNESRAAPPSGSLEALWRAPGEDVAIVPGTSDYAPGANRVSFLVVDKQSRLVEGASARVWVARGLDQKPFLRTTARSERIGGIVVAEADIRAQ